jgi:IS30 family transposase
MTYKSADDYVAVLRELGGEASSTEIADEIGRHEHTVNRMLDPARDDIDRVARKRVGNAFYYRLTEDAATSDAQTDDEDDAQEGEDA